MTQSKPMAFLVATRFNLLTLMVCLVAGFGLNHATAHTGATGIVKQRMDLMDQISKDMKHLKAMIRGLKSYDPLKVRQISLANNQAAEKIPDQFPEGSLQHPTEARPEIWQKWDKFSAYNRELVLESQRLSEIAETAQLPAIQNQFRELSKTCLGCHKSFRKKKKKS